jgi:hypothetical protein
MTAEDRQRLVTLAPEFGIRLLPSATPRDVANRSTPCATETRDKPSVRIDVQSRLGPRDTDLVLLRRSVTPGLSVTLHSPGDRGCLFVIDGEITISSAVEYQRPLQNALSTTAFCMMT